MNTINLNDENLFVCGRVSLLADIEIGEHFTHCGRIFQVVAHNEHATICDCVLNIASDDQEYVATGHMFSSDTFVLDVGFESAAEAVYQGALTIQARKQGNVHEGDWVLTRENAEAH